MTPRGCALAVLGGVLGWALILLAARAVLADGGWVASAYSGRHDPSCVGKFSGNAPHWGMAADMAEGT